VASCLVVLAYITTNFLLFGGSYGEGTEGYRQYFSGRFR
jgi:hypothetical protein